MLCAPWLPRLNIIVLSSEATHKCFLLLTRSLRQEACNRQLIQRWLVGYLQAHQASEELMLVKLCFLPLVKLIKLHPGSSNPLSFDGYSGCPCGYHGTWQTFASRRGVRFRCCDEQLGSQHHVGLELAGFIRTALCPMIIRVVVVVAAAAAAAAAAAVVVVVDDTCATSHQI